MNRVKIVSSLWIAAIASLAAVGSAPAQMCGGHTMQSHGSEVSQAPTATDVADAIESYVRHDAKMKGGYFVVYDPERQVPLVLTLDRVHEDRLRRVEDHEYFTCADFTATDGTGYDLDIFMRGPDKDHLEIASISVHQANGTPRYDWQERDGIWSKRPMARSDGRADGEQPQARTASRFEITVDGAGFHPSSLSMPVGTPATLVVTRTTDRTCAKEIVIQSLGIAEKLPLNEAVEIVVTPDRRGDLRFACGMDMLAGVIHVE